MNKKNMNIMGDLLFISLLGMKNANFSITYFFPDVFFGDVHEILIE